MSADGGVPTIGFARGAADAQQSLDWLAKRGVICPGRIALSLDDGPVSPGYIAGAASVLGYEPIVILAPRAP